MPASHMRLAGGLAQRREAILANFYFDGGKTQGKAARQVVGRAARRRNRVQPWFALCVRARVLIRADEGRACGSQCDAQAGVEFETRCGAACRGRRPPDKTQ